jgi:hypothetical protein
MAKYKVLKDFQDAKTHEGFKFGQVADYPDKRAKEINDAGEAKYGGPFLEAIEVKEAPKKAAKAKK